MSICVACGLPTNRPEIKERYPGDVFKGRTKGMCRPCYRKTRERDLAQADRDRYLAERKAIYQRLKGKVFALLGDHCECCEEKNVEFLAIDHIDGGGYAHRKKRNQSGVYRDILKLENPKASYRILCFNCNWSLGTYGYCPHKKEKKDD